MTNYDKDIEDLIKLLNSPLPSENLLNYWISHFSDIIYPEHTEYGGKWLIFENNHNIDKTWEKIKEAQDKGLLGQVSKVSTAKEISKYKNHVICIYTYDSKDMYDVLRVREALKKLGFTKPINYKRDIETKKGIYGTNNEFLLKI